jgi:hypothetical protein
LAERSSEPLDYDFRWPKSALYLVSSWRTLSARLGGRDTQCAVLAGRGRAERAPLPLAWPARQRAQRTRALGHSTNGRDRVGVLAAALDVDLHDLFRTREGTPKGRAVEKLHEFGMRLTVQEIELVIDVGAVALKHARNLAADPGRASHGA